MRWGTAIRKTAKWGGTVGAVVIAMMLVASLWWSVTWYSTDGYAVGCGRAIIAIGFAQQ